MTIKAYLRVECKRTGLENLIVDAQPRNGSSDFTKMGKPISTSML